LEKLLQPLTFDSHFFIEYSKHIDNFATTYYIKKKFGSFWHFCSKLVDCLQNLLQWNHPRISFSFTHLAKFLNVERKNIVNNV